MNSVHHLGTVDYLFISLSLLTSLGIGFYFQFSGNKKETTKDFLLAGKNMSQLPVVLSIAVTYLSAILIIGVPAETYMFGPHGMVVPFGAVIGFILACYLFLPIYFNLGISSIYEYLEMRYGKLTRMAVSALFILQMILYMCIVLYAPSLALSAVTDLSTETSIILMGIVCVIYCTMGGLKAVLWTDTFQFVLMFACVLTVFTAGLIEVGGMDEVIRISQEGERWQFFNFDADLTTRYTVWNCVFRGISIGLGGYGVSQLEVQRLLSINVLSKAQSALLWSLPPLLTLLFLCYFTGLIIYAVFYHCDPILNGEFTGLTRYDQLVPYFIVTRMNHIPGLTGICIAGLFSGSLSTISSAINCLSTVTVVDFIQPYTSLKDRQTVWIAKGLVTLYGALCIGLSFLFGQVGTLLQMGGIAISLVEGPVIAIFLLGILTERTNEMGSSIGFLAGCFMAAFIGYGSALSKFVYPILPLTTENCPGNTNITGTPHETFVNESMTVETNSTLNNHEYQSDVFYLYRISYMWVPVIGFIVTACVSYLVSCLTDWNKKKKIDPTLLSPLVRKWMKTFASEDADENVEVRKAFISDTVVQSIKNKTISDCAL